MIDRAYNNGLSKMHHHWLSILFISGIIYNTCAFSIDCDEFYYDDTVSKIWGYVYYSCNGTVMTHSNNNQTMMLFGLHLHGRNSSYTESFVLNNQNLTSFPMNSEKFFPYLRIIDFSFNHIVSVTNNQLQPHKRLSLLFLEYNRISNLDSNLFDGLDNLIEVRLNNNNIKHVGHGIKLPSNVYMNNNPCTPICCNFMSFYMTISITEFLCNQCPPLQSTVRKSVDFTRDLGTVNTLDHTQEMSETAVTVEPSIKVKRPKMGEVLHCSFEILLRENDEPLGKRCSEMYNSQDSAFSFLRAYANNPEFKRKLKEDIEMRNKEGEEEINADNLTLT